MKFARESGYIVFTHDLDFGAILAATQAEAPSVIQARTQNIMSDKLVKIVVGVLIENEAALKDGALITINESKERVRLLPLRRS